MRQSNTIDIPDYGRDNIIISVPSNGNGYIPTPTPSYVFDGYEGEHIHFRKEPIIYRYMKRDGDIVCFRTFKWVPVQDMETVEHELHSTSMENEMLRERIRMLETILTEGAKYYVPNNVFKVEPKEIQHMKGFETMEIWGQETLSISKKPKTDPELEELFVL